METVDQLLILISRRSSHIAMRDHQESFLSPNSIIIRRSLRFSQQPLACWIQELSRESKQCHAGFRVAEGRCILRHELDCFPKGFAAEPDPWFHLGIFRRFRIPSLLYRAAWQMANQSGGVRRTQLIGIIRQIGPASRSLKCRPGFKGK